MNIDKTIKHSFNEYDIKSTYVICHNIYSIIYHVCNVLYLLIPVLPQYDNNIKISHLYYPPPHKIFRCPPTAAALAIYKTRYCNIIRRAGGSGEGGRGVRDKSFHFMVSIYNYNHRSLTDGTHRWCRVYERARWEFYSRPPSLATAII